jgi:predicted transcriptional regulator
MQGDSRMKNFNVFPNKRIEGTGPISRAFLELGIKNLHDACRRVHEMPYGYNSDRDDLMILFKEKMGSCTTKHAVIATLAMETGLPIEKSIGVYAMTEEIVAGTDNIIEKYGLPYIPMVHCFLVYDKHWVDLTEGNNNGKKRPIEEFLYTKKVVANISARDEYLLYRKALTDTLLKREELNGFDLKRILHAREEGIALLKANIK